MGERLLDRFDFLENNLRHKALFLILFRNSDFITSEELAKKLDVTSRTVKSDIKYITEQLDIDGLKIVSQRSKGTMIQVDNPELEKSIKEYFKIYQENNIDNDFDKNVQYILRRLLVSDKPVKVEEIQEELYLNTSNYIKREMQEVKRILEQYNLKLITKTKEGLVISGNEYNRYLCVLRMYKFFSNAVHPTFKEKEFGKLFKPNFASYQEIKSIVCKSLLNTRIVFSDIYLERFVLYIILLSNLNVAQEKDSLENIGFDYKITDEYQLVLDVDETLGDNFVAYQSGDETVIEYLTYLAIMSTDLYRTRDCTENNYGQLIKMAEEIRTYIIQQFEETFKVCISDDIVFLKDLLKILIPISMKIKLGVSDDVDLGFYNQHSMAIKPVIKEFINGLSININKKYLYMLSFREKHLLLNIIYEFVNNIHLEHKKMKIAIIALDGRLSTQQLKFNIRKYFSSYIESLDTKVLYELNEIDSSVYNCFFCLEFGKNMDIPYEPIYYFREGASDVEYQKQLQEVFLSSYHYNLFLPKISYKKISPLYKLNEYPIEKYLNQNKEYMKLLVGDKKYIDIYINFESKEESINIHYFEDDGLTINGRQCFIIINLNIAYNKQKFKMLLNVINKIVKDSTCIKKLYTQQEIYIETIFKK